jgi:hypothetical protein
LANCIRDGNAAHDSSAPTMEATKALNRSSRKHRISQIKSSSESQVTSLRIPNKWHVCKEGRAGNKNDNAAACLSFLTYLDRRRSYGACLKSIGREEFKHRYPDCTDAPNQRTKCTGERSYRYMKRRGVRRFHTGNRCAEGI